MRATFTGKATSIRRPKEFSTNEFVEIDLDTKGTIDSTNVAAKAAQFKGTLMLKPIVAEALPFGTTFTITIEDETKPAPTEAS